MATTTAPASTAPPLDPVVLSLRETASMLGHSYKTALNLRSQGGHPVYNKLAIKMGHRVIFRMSSILACLEDLEGKEV